MDDLRGRVAVVTGAASGIGLGIARAFAAEGMRLALTDIDEARLARVRDELGATTEVEAVVTDVGDPDAVEALARRTVDRFGGVHLVCNNAGTMVSGPLWELPLSEWERVLRINLMGVVHGIRSFVPRILATGEGGHVVNVGSMASVTVVRGIGPYNVAKHGVLALSEGLAKELSRNDPPIGVTLLMPGRVRSRLGLSPDTPDRAEPDEPEAGVIEPDEVGPMVVDAVRHNRLYQFTHPESAGEARRRFARITGDA
jgi:NAD(P)-dependent dehydrogenase (short-subunit alcohol dehydrogenase family)